MTLRIVNEIDWLVDSVSGVIFGYQRENGISKIPSLGIIESDNWISIPSIFRLRLTGTGTVAMHARNALGVVTSNVATYSPSSATNQIEFPYAGDDAVEVSFTTTGTATVEVI